MSELPPSYPPPGDSSPPRPTAPPPGYQPPGYPPPGGAVAAGGQQNQKAIISLVLGIAGFFICPLVGIAAIILGGQAKGEIRGSGGGQTGEGMATWGVILGWLQIAEIVLVILAILLGTMGLLFGATHSTPVQ
ncbi:MAG: DUF4190 domain-containing protein [Candidatus Dormibacteria bacterium]